MTFHQGIIPPHMLEHIRDHGTPEQRELAEVALQQHQSVIGSRELAPGVPTTRALGAPPATVAIYDAQGTTTLPGVLVRGDAAPATGDAETDEAHDGLRATLDFYSGVYSRNSVDDAGLDLIGTVHYGHAYDNAEWTGTQMLFGDGDGTLFNRFTIAIDVMGHELTHGVTQYTAALDYQDQAGALNESMSDVFGSMVKQYHASPQQTADQADWLIGAGLLAAGINGVALRSMKAPGTAYDDPQLGKDPQPADMAHYVHTSDDNGGVHINSGIPNRAFYLAATGFGGYAWEKAGRIWYETLTGGHLPASATFAKFAQLTVTNAGTLFGADAVAVVRDAWHQVGVATKVPASDGQTHHKPKKKQHTSPSTP